MGTLVFVCPTTGHEVSTGVEVDIQLQTALENEDGGLLSALSQEPYTRGNLGLVGRRGPRAGRQCFYEVCCVDRLPLALNDPIQFTSLFVRQARRSCEELRSREPGSRIVFTR